MTDRRYELIGLEHEQGIREWWGRGWPLPQECVLCLFPCPISESRRGLLGSFLMHKWLISSPEALTSGKNVRGSLTCVPHACHYEIEIRGAADFPPFNMEVWIFLLKMVTYLRHGSQLLRDTKLVWLELIWICTWFQSLKGLGTIYSQFSPPLFYPRATESLLQIVLCAVCGLYCEEGEKNVLSCPCAGMPPIISRDKCVFKFSEGGCGFAA